MVVPAAIPVTTPVVPTVPDAVVTLLQVPPVDVSPKDVVLPAHTFNVPVNAAGVVGNGLTVTTVVAAALPQLFVLL